jgi:probable HAF family extracellular repeat protein
LGTLGGPDSGAFLINESGQISGWSFTNSTVNSTTGLPTLDPFFWENGKMLDMGTLGGVLGQSFALNNGGQVAGYSDLAGDQSCHPFLWDKTGGMKDLGTLGGDSGLAYFVNDAGEVVGSANVPGAFGCDNGAQNHAFLWRNGVMTDLGAPDGDTCSGAAAINSKGQIVGGGDDCNGGLQHAFLSEDGGPAIALDTLIPPKPGLQLTDAVYINDSGEIAALATISNGDLRAFVLIPCDEYHPGIEGCDYSLVDAAAAAEVQPPQITTETASASSRTMPFPRGMTTRVRLPWRGHGTPKPATHFSVSAPATAAIGSAFSFTVTAVSSSNTVATGYTGTAHFTSSDGQAVLPANSTLTNGVGNFMATLNTAGAQTITAADAATPSITGASSAITVSALSSLAITSGEPPNGTAGSDYSGSRKVCFLTQCVFIGGFHQTASGGVAPYTWSWAAATGSSLPPGLFLLRAGFIAGQPTTPGVYNVVATVTDSESPAAHVSVNYTISIAPNPSQVTVTISASADPPSAPRGSVGLIWSSTNATSCSASASPNVSNWSGSEPTSGSAVVPRTPQGESIKYTLTCTGAPGSVSASASVTVNAPCIAGPCRGFPGD